MSTSEGSVLDARSNSSHSSGSLETRAVLPTIFMGRYYTVLHEKCNQTNAIARCNLCRPEQEIKGQWSSTSNFRSHLKRKHHAEFLEYVDQVERIKRRNAVYQGAGSQNRFQMDMAKFIISAMLPLQVVENVDFRRMFHNLGLANKIKNISRRTIGRCIDRLYVETTQKIKSDLSGIPFICTTADIWSSKQRSFLGVTAHWITQNYERKSAALGCRRFCGTHSYDRIKNLLHCIHSQFDLDTGKIVATVTDNASNFVKAFKEYGVKLHCIIIEDNETINPVNGEEEREGEETEQEEEEEEGEEEEEQEAADEAEDEEAVTIQAVPENVLPRHIRCAVHTLHLCVTSDLMQAMKSTPELLSTHKDVMEKCNVLWKACNRPKSSEIFKNITGQILKRPGDTRWNSLYDSLQQIVQLKPKLVEIGKALGTKNILKENDIIYIEEHIQCTAPIAQAIDILQGDKDIFYGTLAPCLFSLRRKLIILALNDWKFCTTISASLLASINKRFNNIFTFSTEESKCAAIAAMSHPKFKNRWFACVEDVYTTILMNSLETAVVQEMKKHNVPIATQAVPSASTSTDDFFYFGEETGTAERTDYSAKASLEILQFFEDCRKNFPVLEKYPHLKTIFYKYNTPVPSSAPVERLFSYATMANSPKRNRTSDQLFERRVVLKGNHQYMEI